MEKYRKAIVIVCYLLPVGYLLFVLGKHFYGNYYLPKEGVCAKAILIDKKVSARTGQRMLYYRLRINGQQFEQNSLETDLTKVGDSVCVLYLKSFPSINRPCRYFDK